jgi:hypothetical protein
MIPFALERKKVPMLGPLPLETSASVRRLTAAVGRAPSQSIARNRRIELRRSARLGCRVRRVDDWSLIGDRTLDLSPRGMLLLSDEQIDPGTDLVVSFQATELPIWFDTMATMVRVVEGRRPGDTGRALGIHFETLPAVSRLILRGFLRRLPAAPPQREPPNGLVAPFTDYARIIRDIWEGRA